MKGEVKWFHPKTKSDWSHTMPKDKRRKVVLKAFHGNLLSAARSKQALANVTQSIPTKKAAQSDADFFYKEYKRSKK